MQEPSPVLEQPNEYPIEEETNQNQHCNNKTQGKPPNNEAQAAWNAKIGIEKCEH